MKKLTLKLGAIASIAVGASLMALPTLAAWRACIRASNPEWPADPYRPEVSSGNCDYKITHYSDGSALFEPTGGQCSSKRVPYGYYCAPDEEGHRTCTSLPNEQVPIERQEGNCSLEWSFPSQNPDPSSTIVGYGNSLTVAPGEEFPKVWSECRPATGWFPSSNEFAMVGACKMP
jgi:hypothetical protein